MDKLLFSIGLLFLSLSCAASTEKNDAKVDQSRENSNYIQHAEEQKLSETDPDSGIISHAEKSKEVSNSISGKRKSLDNSNVVEHQDSAHNPTEDSSTSDVHKESNKSKDPGHLLPKESDKADGSTTTEMVVPDHTLWDQVLKQIVSANGNVNYDALHKSPSKFNEYISYLNNNPVQSSWSPRDQLAYWINVYNAFTVKLIIDNYPVNRITDLHGGKPWDVKWISLREKKYSLNQIENEIIRPVFKEPRIHFAVNCAAKSCPPLLNRAWTATNLEQNFQKQTSRFLNNPTFNIVESDKLQLSKIFEWYAEDFGDLISFIKPYVKNVNIKPNAQITYLEYNWSLNGR